MASKTDRILNSLKARPQIQQPIATDMFIPNLSGVASHPETDANFVRRGATSSTNASIPVWSGTDGKTITTTELTIDDGQNLNCKNNAIINVLDPTADQQAATKKYVDDMNYTQGARVYNDGTQSISNGATIILDFDTERWDNDGIWTAGANSDRLICNTAGKYVVSASLQFAGNTTGNRILKISGAIGGVTVTLAYQNTPGTSGTTNLCCTTIVDLAVTEYVQFRVFQNSGGSLNVDAGTSTLMRTCDFSMHRIGPSS